MATSLTLQNDASLAQGYIQVNGTTSATFTTSGITGNLTGNADTATKLSTTTGSAPAYACRAWVYFDGTRDTTGAVSTANTNRLIRSSGNVTSVLRNAAGTYTVNFATAMSDANYAASTQYVRVTTFVDSGIQATNSSASACSLLVRENNINIDAAAISLQVFGN